MEFTELQNGKSQEGRFVQHQEHFAHLNADHILVEDTHIEAMRLVDQLGGLEWISNNSDV